MRRPLAIDLFCGLGGWAEGFLAEGYEVIGFDIERWPYPGQLVLQDVLTLHGSWFKHTTVIVASPPCQAYSYRAMPWTRAKALGPPDNTLFETCFRIQREASEAAGHKIPMIVENVKGAQLWVGRAKWHYGSYYLWGDVPALMPMTGRLASKNANHGSWFAIGSPGQTQTLGNPINGTKEMGQWWHNPNGIQHFASQSTARKQASAMIAKIPFELASHIAKVFKPQAGGYQGSGPPLDRASWGFLEGR